MAAAISSGVPILLRGITSRASNRSFSVENMVISVSIYPGAMAFTVILYGANSKASDLVNPNIPDLEEA